MADVTTDRDVKVYGHGDILNEDYPVKAAEKIPGGVIVTISTNTTTALAQNGGNDANTILAGISAYGGQDNTDGLAGDLMIRVQREGFVEMDSAVSLTNANLGATFYVSDNHTVTTTAGNGVVFGTLHKVISGTRGVFKFSAV